MGCVNGKIPNCLDDFENKTNISFILVKKQQPNQKCDIYLIEERPEKNPNKIILYENINYSDTIYILVLLLDNLYQRIKHLNIDLSDFQETLEHVLKKVANENEEYKKKFNVQKIVLKKLKIIETLL